MKPGDTFKQNGVDLLVLDIVNDKPFVLAYNLDIQILFSKTTNNYKNSNLRAECEKWFAATNFKVQSRMVDLTTMDGYKGYGAIPADVAPLTFDEYRKYADIIIPHIKNWFWTVTGWGRPNIDNWSMNTVCFVNGNGNATNDRYNSSFGSAPAFILDKVFTSYPDISIFPTKELVAELNRRMNKED
jgi:hypothetical protein